MQSATLSVGDSIEARCTKCRKNNTHIIITMSEDGPTKVQCTICSRQHKYRPPSAIKKPALTRAEQEKKAERQEWADMQQTMTIENASAYSMTDSYRVKSIINHPMFGLGLVQRIVGPQKIEVLFEDGKKTMRCK